MSENALCSLNIEKSKRIIRLADYYPNNCSEQEYVEVSDEIYEVYKMFQRESNKQTVSDYRHIKLIYFDENILGEMFGAIKASIDKEVIDKIWLEQLFMSCGKNAFRRAIMYFVNGLSTREIAAIEKVSHTAVVKSINQIKNIVKKTISEEDGKS